MKPTIIILLSVNLLAMAVLTGCSSTRQEEFSKTALSGQRVIKVSFIGSPNSFRFRINQYPVERLGNTDFTNVMTQLHLGYGDIVVWEDQRDENGKELSHPEGISAWWVKQLENVRASFYSIRSDNVADFFSAPIFYWKAPPDKPRPLKDATFFVDGVTLGRGSSGFKIMIEAIEKNRTRPIFILAPRIKNEGQASPWIADDQLITWANDAGVYTKFDKIFTGGYTGQLDFARFMDEQ